MYQRIETNDVKSTILSTLEKLNVTAETKLMTCRGKGTKHVLKFRLNIPIAFADNDTGFAEIVVFNSYAGESALTISVGLYRLVCSNGLILGKTFYSDRIVHRQGQKVTEFLATLPQKIAEAVAFIDTKLVGRVQELSKPLSYLQAARIVHELTLSASAKRQILDTLDPVNAVYLRKQDRELTYWTLWNIINETLAKRSRSPYANEKKNLNLLENILDIQVAA
jgi:hypothetical protein